MATEQVVEFSDSLQVLQKPKRWDAPFSFELQNPAECLPRNPVDPVKLRYPGRDLRTTRLWF